MKIAKVNADYEFELFHSELSKDIEEATISRPKDFSYLDFLFLFINKDKDLSLSSQVDFSENYLEWLSKYNISSRIDKTSPPSLNWFGKLSNIKLEKRLNDKTQNYKFAHHLKINLPLHFFVKDMKELHECSKELRNKLKILKSPYLNGGLNIKVFKNETEINQINGTRILEEYQERFFDISIHFCPQTNKVDYSFPLINHSGISIGSMFFNSDALRDQYIHSLGISDHFQNYLFESYKIVEELQSQKLEQPLCIDGYMYKIDGKIKYTTLCEINYRRNMVCFAIALKDLIPEKGAGILYNLKRKHKISLRDKFYDREKKTGIIEIGPDNNPMSFVLVAANDLVQLNKLKKNFIQIYKIIES